jgi:hypothetical protein
VTAVVTSVGSPLRSDEHHRAARAHTAAERSHTTAADTSADQANNHPQPTKTEAAPKRSSSVGSHGHGPARTAVRVRATTSRGSSRERRPAASEETPKPESRDKEAPRSGSPPRTAVKTAAKRPTSPPLNSTASTNDLKAATTPTPGKSYEHVRSKLDLTNPNARPATLFSKRYLAQINSSPAATRVAADDKGSPSLRHPLRVAAHDGHQGSPVPHSSKQPSRTPGGTSRQQSVSPGPQARVRPSELDRKNSMVTESLKQFRTVAPGEDLTIERTGTAAAPPGRQAAPNANVRKVRINRGAVAS